MGCASTRGGWFVVGLAVVALLGGCTSLGSERRDLSEGDRSAVESLYDGPMFAEVPPGAGELLGEDFPLVCGDEGADPTGGRAWVLLDGGEAAISYYRQLGLDDGWEVIEETEPSRDAESDGRRANLVLRKTESGYTYSFGVSIGRSILHDDVEIGALGGIAEPSVCGWPAAT